MRGVGGGIAYGGDAREVACCSCFPHHEMKFLYASKEGITISSCLVLYAIAYRAAAWSSASPLTQIPHDPVLAPEQLLEIWLDKLHLLDNAFDPSRAEKVLTVYQGRERHSSRSLEKRRSEHREQIQWPSLQTEELRAGKEEGIS